MCISILVFALVSWPGLAMSAITSEALSSLSVRHVSMADGLPHPAVYSIVQDAQDYVWFGTQDGLGRFDGSHFTVLRANRGSDKGLAVSGFGRMVRGAGDHIWLGTWGGGLQRLDSVTGEIESFDLLHGESPLGGVRLVEAMTWQAKPGVLWVSLRGNGLFRLDPRSGSVVHHQYGAGMAGTLGSRFIAALLVDRQNRLWVGGDGGLERFDSGSNTFLHVAGMAELGSDRVRAIAQDAHGALWVGTRGAGITRLDRDGHSPERVWPASGATGDPGYDDISSLMFDHTGALWIGTLSRGVSHLLPGERVPEHASIPRDGFKALSHGNIERFFQDRLHNVWVATRDSGAYVYDLTPEMLRRIRGEKVMRGKLLGSDVRALAYQVEKNHTILWIGTDGKGLLRYDPIAGSVRQFRHHPQRSTSLSSNVITSLLVARDGVLWVGTLRDGLNRAVLRGDELVFDHFLHSSTRPGSLSSNIVQVLGEGSVGAIWVATSAGLDRWRTDVRSVEFEHYRHDSAVSGSLPAGIVLSLCVNDEQGVWVGTSTGLAYLHLDTGRTEPITLETAGHGGPVSVLALSGGDAPRSTLWVGTNQGLIKLNIKTGAVRRYGIVNGLPGNDVGAVTMANPENLWLSAGRGLTRFDVRAELFHNYGEFDQEPVVGFNKTALLRLPDGKLLVGGFDGLAVLDPKREDRAQPVPALVLTHVLVNGVERPGPPWRQDNPLQLDYRHNTVALEFTLLDFRDPRDHEYAYRMDGVDDHWVWSSGHNVARYADLPPGSYRFDFRSSTRGGQWIAATARIGIVITAPWWQQTSIRVAILLLLMASLYGSVKWRIRVVDLRNAELREFNRSLQREIERRKHAEADVLQAQKLQAVGSLAGGVAHDFNNILQAVQGYIELAKNQPGSAHKVADYLHQALVGVRRAASLVRKLLTFSRPSPDDLCALRLQNVVREVIDLLAGTVPERISVELALDDACGPVLADATQMHQVVLNLCSNAFQAMRGRSGKLRITLDEVAGHVGDGGLPDDAVSDHFARLRIIDTGIGLAEEMQSRLFDPFFTTRHGTGGTGLGLAVAYSIVRNSGGAIRAFNNAGIGCTFEIVLPVLTREFSQQISAPAEPRPMACIGRLLCVDDEPALTNVLRLGFEARGVKVDTFTTASEALARFCSDPQRYAAAILDQRMPMMSGLRLAARLRSLRPDLSIVLLIGGPAADIRRDPDFVHVSRLVLKPVRIEDLLGTVVELCGQSAAE